MVLYETASKSSTALKLETGLELELVNGLKAHGLTRLTRKLNGLRLMEI